MIHIGWPQGIFIVCTITGLLFQANDGELTISVILAQVLTFSLLYWGGFFS